MRRRRPKPSRDRDRPFREQRRGRSRGRGRRRGGRGGRRMRDQVCKFFQRTGKCMYGDECKFSHHMMSLPGDNGNEVREPVIFLTEFHIKDFISNLGQNMTIIVDQLNHHNMKIILNDKNRNFHHNEYKRIIAAFSRQEFIKNLKSHGVTAALETFVDSYFCKKLGRYIRRGTMSEKELLNIIIVFKEIMKRLPNEIENLCIAEIEGLSNKNDWCIEDVRELIELRDKIENQEIMEENKFEIEKGENEIFDNFLLHKQLIEPNSVDINKQPILRKATTYYPDKNTYYSTHFTLIKEDYLSKIREGIEGFENGTLDKRDMNVFEDVFYVRCQMNKYCHFECNVKFKKEHQIGRIRTTNKLKISSLVCLFRRSEFNNPEKKILSFLVSDNDKIHKGYVSLRPLKEEDFSAITRGVEYIMCESPVFWQAYEPVLTSLKEKSDLPFEKLFLGENIDNNPPEYIIKKPSLVISPFSRVPFKINDCIKNWIETENTTLDDSQNITMRNIFNSRVSLVEGPPGTGKTFMGRKMAEVLCSKYNSHIPKPIVVICYTNHALDAFLLPLMDKIPNMIRVGGRSKSTNREYLNKNLKYHMSSYTPKYLYEELEQKKIELQSISYCQNLVQKHFYSWIFEQDIFKELHIFGNMGFNGRYIIRKWISGDLEDLLKQYVNREIKRQEKERNQKIEEEKKKAMGSNQFSSLYNNNEMFEEKEQTKEDLINSKREKEREMEKIFRGLSRDLQKTKDFKVQHAENQDTGEKEIMDNEKVDEFIEDQMIKDREEAENEIRELLFEENRMLDLKSKKFSYHTPTSIANFLSKIPKVIGYNKMKSERYSKYIELECPQEREYFLEEIKRTLEEKLKNKESNLFKKVKKCLEQREEYKQQKEVSILRNADIIGMTSTGAAMRRKALNSIGAKIFIFEEIGELLEGQVLACLPDFGLQHIICIGDIYQLKPKFECYNLKDKHIDLSLLERLMKLGVKHTTLNIQQRMRPEISNIITTVFKKEYPTLKDHESVLKLPNIPGMTSNVQFFTHTKHEEFSGRSHVNKFEAKIVINLAIYISKQDGMDPSDITIVTPYKGQLFEIRREFELKGKQKKYLEKFTVSTTDDYQGEENRVIILSLVRSTFKFNSKKTNIGFLDIQNRIIVSLSRAKEGLYIIGNSGLFSEINDDWSKIITLFEQKKYINNCFTLGCAKHPLMITNCKDSSDFKPIIHGGCTKMCREKLECGHRCPLKCHPGEHSCYEICDEVMDCGHKCRSYCHHNQNHPNCRIKVEHSFKTCDHTIKVECHVDKNSLICNEKCGKILKCGHKCNTFCCSCQKRGYCVCTKRLKGYCQRCKNNFFYICGEKRCENRCPVILECGHGCSGKCCECFIRGSHQKCEEKCSRVLICGHSCSKGHSCSEKCSECAEQCRYVCTHGDVCKKKCSEICIRCKMPCPNGCKHTGMCKNKCHEPCSIVPCSEPCTKKFKKCGHSCPGICNGLCPEICIECDSKKKEEEQWKCPISQFISKEIIEEKCRLYKLPCGHSFVLEYLDGYMNEIDESIGYKKCPSCKEPICNLFLARRYEKVIKKSLMDIQRVKWEMEKMEEKHRLDAIKAVQGTYSAGHWFKCSCGEPYFIGECGGAMEKGKCPKCKGIIGGSHHVLFEGNSRATEIDGEDV